jgi:hypothetical protein
VRECTESTGIDGRDQSGERVREHGFWANRLIVVTRNAVSITTPPGPST